VAVKVTDWLRTLGLAEELTVVIVPDWLTVCISGEAMLSLPL